MTRPSIDPFALVVSMHEKFNIPAEKTPGFLDPDTMEFRLKFLQEELAETIAANDEENLEELADGLVDLVVVALGTAAMMGIDFNSCFLEVHRANMSKVRVEHAGESKRGSGYDLKKPFNWKKPNLRPILGLEDPDKDWIE